MQISSLDSKISSQETLPQTSWEARMSTQGHLISTHMLWHICAHLHIWAHTSLPSPHTLLTKHQLEKDFPKSCMCLALQALLPWVGGVNNIYLLSLLVITSPWQTKVWSHRNPSWELVTLLGLVTKHKWGVPVKRVGDPKAATLESLLPAWKMGSL